MTSPITGLALLVVFVKSCKLFDNNVVICTQMKMFYVFSASLSCKCTLRICFVPISIQFRILISMWICELKYQTGCSTRKANLVKIDRLIFEITPTECIYFFVFIIILYTLTSAERGGRTLNFPECIACITFIWIAIHSHSNSNSNSTFCGCNQFTLI